MGRRKVLLLNKLSVASLQIIYLKICWPGGIDIHIQENIQNYRIVVYREDLLDIGQTIEKLIANLIEASGLCGKPLGEYQYTYDPKDMSWVIFLQKEGF